MVAFRKGDFSARLPTGWSGVQGRIADLFNEIVKMSERRLQQAAEVARIVGKEGRSRQRMATGGFIGSWAEEIDALNTLMDDLARPTTEITRTIGVVAKGDAGLTMALEVDGGGRCKANSCTLQSVSTERSSSLPSSPRRSPA